MKLGIRAKLFLVSLGLIAASMVAADAFLTTALDADLTKRVRGDLFVRLRLMERDASLNEAPLDDRAAWHRLAHDLGRRSGSRVTVIRRDGWVLGDSELDRAELEQVENHANRPEVIEALSRGGGTSTRWSDTLKRRMLYAAIPFAHGGEVAGTVRAARPLTEVDQAVAHLRRLVLVASGIALSLALLLTTLASHWMSKTVRALTATARRMADGDLSARAGSTGEDEIAQLGRALDQMAGGLQAALGSLRMERDLMGRVLQGMREGVLLVDGNGRVALTNAALREMLLLGADAVGKTPLEIIRNAALKQILEDAASSTQPITSELEIGDFKPRRLLVHAAALAGDAGSILVVFVDVTDLRRLETLRRDFVANASHELRTPVASLRSAAETLRRAIEAQPEAAGEFVAMIERNTERLHRLIEDLLDLSRIESREFKLRPEPVEVAQVVRPMLALFQERADAKQMRLAAVLPKEPLVVQMDRRALEQVLTNLVDNAVKYASAGASVVVRATAEDAGLRLSVEDSGPGIEAKHLPRLFERFYRVDAGRSRDLGGTGLGLSIVKHLVEAMGGSVGVQSAVGKGTTFAVLLPQL
jgi:two-component system phosphate regulon sensor histidine kinase PhoR